MNVLKKEVIVPFHLISLEQVVGFTKRLKVTALLMGGVLQRLKKLQMKLLQKNVY
jgi:hypothetical protein